ncbi:MAG: HlyD family efflux transporter periplasmic adaptor subunit [Melioribacteraceae bacterium]|nr:HlyD family efflux transporter periplasmic adaptor subunit [Melioribacteraceae bacterium]
MDRQIEKKFWSLKRILGISFGILFLAFIVYSFVFGDSSRKLNVDKDRITISTVRVEAFREFIPPIGEVMPIETFFLDVTEGGRIVEKFIEEGAFVDIGDPIIKLDNPTLSLSLMFNESQVFQSLNDLRGTRLQMEQYKLDIKRRLLDIDFQIKSQKREYELRKKLFEKGLGSQIEYEESKDNYDYLKEYKALTLETQRQDSLFRVEQIRNQESNVKQMELSLGSIRKQLDNLTVKAPIKGQLTSLNGEIGQAINRGQNLGRIDDIDSFKVRVPVDEYYLARIRTGLEGEFEFNGKVHQLVISAVFPQIQDGRFNVDMLFKGELPKGIRRGQTVHLRLALSDVSESMVVDRGGFYQATGGQWTFVVDPSGEFAVKRKIKINRENTEVYEISDGLIKGEKVIISSYDNFGDAEKLILK